MAFAPPTWPPPPWWSPQSQKRSNFYGMSLCDFCRVLFWFTFNFRLHSIFGIFLLHFPIRLRLKTERDFCFVFNENIKGLNIDTFSVVYRENYHRTLFLNWERCLWIKNIVLELRTFDLKNRVSTFWNQYKNEMVRREKLNWVYLTTF